MGQSQSDMPDLIEVKAPPPTPVPEPKPEPSGEADAGTEPTAADADTEPKPKPAPAPASVCKKCPQQKAKMDMLRIVKALQAIQTCEARTVEECHCRQNAQLAERLVKGMCAACPAAATCPALK